MPGGKEDNANRSKVKVIRDKVKRDNVGPLSHCKNFEFHSE